ncbi:MAG: lytic transglycosylase domain-containing protein, partial [Candidatus Competibacteraceae bacterium]|nr:lytic transglycosylase domain-containing protein [Candidatus Competibacteraceae bacterium]
RYDQQQRSRQQQAGELALNMFYSIKNLELQISNLEERLAGTAREGQYLADLSQRRRELAALRTEYDRFVETLDLGPKPENDRQKLMLNIARVFGECQLNMPADFMQEVERYIALWQGSSRLERAMARLRDQGFAPLILEELTARQLPPQFIYLALQESNFNPRIVGPPTRYGHAKGMWQFIPATGARYGLTLGPLQDEPVYDPQDERHDPVKSTRAAAHYLKDIYRTDAQASGLLVMASYNWGEGNIIRLIRRMPENPRERNFWELLREHRIPEETYNYVFYIFSAAVIGENPQLFGFDFPSPLAGIDRSSL